MPRFTETNPPKRLPPHSNRGAIRKLAELYDVSEKAIKDALKKEAAVIDGWKRVLARK